MSEYYILYDPGTGEVLQKGSAPQGMIPARILLKVNAEASTPTFGDVENILISEEVYNNLDTNLIRVNIEADSPYYENKTPISYSVSKLNLTADGVDEAVIDGLPYDSFALFDGVSYSTSDGMIEFSADVPGSYEITLRHPLFLDTNLTITAI